MSVQRLVRARFRRGGTIRDEHGETVEQLIHGPVWALVWRWAGPHGLEDLQCIAARRQPVRGGRR
jgi:hypothetical protein